jgi:hypothetical protein
MLGLAICYYFFNPFFLKFYLFNSNHSIVSNAHNILGAKHQDCVFSYVVSICSQRRETEGRKEKWSHAYLHLFPLFRTINLHPQRWMSPYTLTSMIN